MALLGLSLYALIGGAATTDFAAVEARFSGRRRAKAVSVLFAVLVVLFYFTWLGEVVPAIITGGVPESVANAGTPTGAALVLDMAWILSAMGLTAVWLWRGRTVAYALAGALLTFAAVITLAIAAMLVAMSLYGQPSSPGMAAIFGIVSATVVGTLFWYLKGTRQK